MTWLSSACASRPLSRASLRARSPWTANCHAATPRPVYAPHKTQLIVSFMAAKPICCSTRSKIRCWSAATVASACLTSMDFTNWSMKARSISSRNSPTAGRRPGRDDSVVAVAREPHFTMRGLCAASVTRSSSTHQMRLIGLQRLSAIAWRGHSTRIVPSGALRTTCRSCSKSLCMSPDSECWLIANISTQYRLPGRELWRVAATRSPNGLLQQWLTNASTRPTVAVPLCPLCSSSNSSVKRHLRSNVSGLTIFSTTSNVLSDHAPCLSANSTSHSPVTARLWIGTPELPVRGIAAIDRSPRPRRHRAVLRARGAPRPRGAFAAAQTRRPGPHRISIQIGVYCNNTDMECTRMKESIYISSETYWP